VTRAAESKTDIDTMKSGSENIKRIFDKNMQVEQTAPSRAGLQPTERQLLSRELHDRVAQAIAAGVNGLELSEHYTRKGLTDRAQAKLADAHRSLRQALEVTKELAAMVRRPHAVEHLRAEPGVRGDEPGDRQPPLDSTEVFLILREAVHNAITHSGAGNITIRLRNDRDAMFATVDDDGSGPAGGGGRPGVFAGLGLRSMHERARLIGGTLNVTRSSSGGTQVVLDIPMQG
jgi:signal transduction histidine kinase